VRKNTFVWVVVPIIALIVLAIPVYGDLHPGQPAPYNNLTWLAIGLILLGVIYTVVLSIVRPKALAQAPALLEGADALESDPVPPTV
jgi:heme exporter protein D